MAREFWSGIRAEVQAAIDRIRPRRATVATVGTGTVTIQELGADAASTEPLARLAGFDLAAAHEVLVADVAGKPMVLGRIQRGAITDQDLTVRNLTVTGTSSGVGGMTALETNGIVTQTATTPTYAARTITGTANQVSVTNGNGVAGNPTIGLPADVTVANTLTVTGALTQQGAPVGYLAGSISASTSVNTTTNQTTVLTTQAITLAAGDVIRASCFGTFANSSTSVTPSLTVRLRQGTTSVVDVPVATTLSQALASNWFWFEAEVAVYSTTSVAGIGGIRAVHDGNTSPNVSLHRLKADTATTIASGSNTWNISLQWSGTTGSATVYGANVEVI